jgi:hypothetical protein
MVSHLIAAAIVITTASPALAQMSPQECNALVPMVQQSVKDISSFLEHLERPPQELGRSSVAETGAALEKARVAVLGPLKQYLNAYQDLAYQLQRCAR